MEKEKTKKIIIVVSIILVIAAIGVIIYKTLTKKQEIYIDIASTDVSYIYGPSGMSATTLSVNDNLKLKIISENDKKVKCYSSDENVIKFDSQNIARALSNGSAKIYCKIKNSKSNVIDVIVGGGN